MLADQSSICPLCSKFIASNRSQVDELPFPIPPLTFDGRTYFKRGGCFYSDSREVRLYSRGWAHARCVPNFWKHITDYKKKVHDRELDPNRVQHWDDWGNYYDEDVITRVLAGLPRDHKPLTQPQPYSNRRDSVGNRMAAIFNHD